MLLPAVESSREIELPGGYDLAIYTLPYTGPGGGQFTIETGVVDRAIDEALHGLLIALSFALSLILGIAVPGGYLLMRRAPQMWGFSWV